MGRLSELDGVEREAMRLNSNAAQRTDTNTLNNLDPTQVQQECLTQLTIYEQYPGGLFSWPMDRVGSKPYGYTIHCSIVEAWNRENRATPIIEFHRNWLSSIDNVKSALVREWD